MGFKEVRVELWELGVWLQYKSEVKVELHEWVGLQEDSGASRGGQGAPEEVKVQLKGGGAG